MQSENTTVIYSSSSTLKECSAGTCGKVQLSGAAVSLFFSEELLKKTYFKVFVLLKELIHRRNGFFLGLEAMTQTAHRFLEQTQGY